MLQQICSTKEESDTLLLLRSVFNLHGMATELGEANVWKERAKRSRSGKTDGLGNMKRKKPKTTTISITMMAIITIKAYWKNSTNRRVYNANLP